MEWALCPGRLCVGLQLQQASPVSLYISPVYFLVKLVIINVHLFSKHKHV